MKHALKLTEELLELLPTHKRALGNKAYYEEALRNKGAGKRGEDSALQDEAIQKVRPQQVFGGTFGPKWCIACCHMSYYEAYKSLLVS